MLRLRLDEYFISTLDFSNTDAKWAALTKELATKLARCNLLKVTLLYRCPKGGECLDFFVFCADGEIFAVQSSISALLDHSSVATIVDIPRLFGDILIERYVFVTVKPEQVVPRKEIALASLPHVRIVSADEWL